VGINRDLFFPLYKKARTLTYTKQNIAEAFRKCGIVPLNPRTVLGDLPKPASKPTFTTFPLEKTPYTKCELRQQTNQALVFVKEASHGEICNLILRFSHTAEYMATTAEIANAQAQKLRDTLKEIGPPGKKDRRQMKDPSNLAGVMTGGLIMKTMEERDRKDQEKAAQKASKQTAKVARKAAAKEAADRRIAAVRLALQSPRTPVRSRTRPGPSVRFQPVDPAARRLRSATSSVPRPNYYLPPLAEQETEPENSDEVDSEPDSVASFAESHDNYRLRPGDLDVDSPLPRRLRSLR
jgi:hypothetical protein